MEVSQSRLRKDVIDPLPIAASTLACSKKMTDIIWK